MMMRMRKIFANLRVGRPDTTPSSPSHVKGIRQGNETGAVDQDGFYSMGPAPRRGMSDVRSTAERSTGINPRARNPVDPKSPNLSPS
jgi:hypothetical protein